MVTFGFTVNCLTARAQAVQTSLSIVSAVAVPPVICHETVAGFCAVIFAGEMLKLSVKGTVTVSV